MLYVLFLLCLFKLKIVANDLLQNELFGRVSSKILLQKMIYYKSHIFNPCGLHELLEYVFLGLLFVVFMNCIDVHLQHLCSCKCFVTRLTFVIVIFVAFMNCVSSNDVHKKMIYHKKYICNLCGLHEVYECVSSNDVLVKMNYHKLHICNLCGLHELYVCVSSNFLPEKMIYHKIHIYDLFGLNELCGCVSLMFLFQKMISHKSHICNL